MTYDEFLANPIYSEINNVIYKFKNKVNGKIYIGQTTTSVRKRVIEHVTNSKPWTKARKGHFQRALYKYGFENFEFSIIEKCIDKNTLNIREIYWIGYYKSDQKEFGYNMTPGGEGNTNYEFNKKCVERLIAANTGKPKSKRTKDLLKFRAKERMKHDKYKKQLEECRSKAWNKNKVKVVKLDHEHNIIKIFDSIKDAAIDIYGKPQGSLSTNLRRSNDGYTGFIKNNHLYMVYDKYQESRL